MRHAVTTLFLLATLASANAAEPQLSPAERIVRHELASSRTWDVISHLCDRIGPRLSGTRQAEAAVRWTTETFRSWGIDVRNEPIMVPVWIRGAEEAILVSHFDQRIVLTTLGGSVATPPAGISADVIEVRSFDEITARKDEVRGKIVLFNVPMDLEKVRAGRAFEAYGEAVVYRGQGASRAAEHGAVAALVRSVASASLRTPHTGAMRYLEGMPQVPAAAVTTEDADLIHRLLARGDRVTMHLKLTPQTLPDVASANVVAEIRGTDKRDEIVLIGAHLDSWDVGTGAIDNGSGVAVVMETMRLLEVLGLEPRRTVRAVLFMNEENGLRGGRGYAEAHKAEIPLHVAAIEADAGAATPLGFVTTLDEQQIAALRKSLGALQTIGATQLTHSAQTGADTSAVTRAGVPGFGLLPDGRHYFDHHHAPSDTLDKVDPEELKRNAAAMAVLTWTLADMPERFPSAPPKQ